MVLLKVSDTTGLTPEIVTSRRQNWVIPNDREHLAV